MVEDEVIQELAYNLHVYNYMCVSLLELKCCFHVLLDVLEESVRLSCMCQVCV